MTDSTADLSASHDPLFEGLTAPQRQAVEHVDGPLLVLAGAGSGKTRVITRRIAHLVLRVGIAPWHILAITFTNKAAGEMRERLTHLLSEKQARAVTVATFHSLCARTIRQYAHLLGLTPNFSIYDTADQQRAVKQAIEELGINTSNFPPSKVLHAISAAKNELLDAQTYESHASDFYARNIARIYSKYQRILQANKATDFDDLLLLTVKLMKEHPDALAELRQRHQYLLIDEYQDTNHAQFLLAHSLAAEHRNLCATGDPDQSIYAWRGADIRNILDFENYYPGARTVRLEQNYRSTKHILAAADGLIRHNQQRRHKELWTENEEGDLIRVQVTADERAEALAVVRWFQDLHIEAGHPWSDMAVFYRANNLSRVMEDALRTSHVPYQIARGTSFYERKEIKDALAYLRMVANPDDAINMLRIINMPARGISAATVKAIQARAIATGQLVRLVVANPASIPGLNNRAVQAVTKFHQQLEQWRALAGFDAPAPGSSAAGSLVSGTRSSGIDAPSSPDDQPISLRGLVERVLRESGLEDHYRNDTTDPEDERLGNLGELISSAQQYEDDLIAINDGQDLPVWEKLAGYLEQVSLVSDVDSIKTASGAVTLMTLHAAKGLEFPIVAMIGMEDGLLPHQRATEEGRDVEEERRLCFVGITRARKKLMLSRALRRSVFGQTLPTIPSRFLAELPKEVLEEVREDDFSSDLPAWDSGASSLTAGSPFPPGTNVRHPLFGLGRVLTVSAGSGGSRAQVHFQKAGVKTLILEYAKLEKA